MLKRQVNQPFGRRSTTEKFKLQKKIEEMRRSTRALEQALTELDMKVRGLSDDSQLASVDLQNALQKQQQTLQMMSNISKILHDTAMGVVRKIGG